MAGLLSIAAPAFAKASARQARGWYNGRLLKASKVVNKIGHWESMGYAGQRGYEGL